MGRAVFFRYFSEMNPWVDFVIVTFEGYADVAKQTIIEAMDYFWTNDGTTDVCYGDEVSLRLMAAGIPFYDIHCEDADTNELWEALMKELDPEIIKS